MIIYNSSKINILYISPYIQMRAENGTVEFLQSLTGRSLIVPGSGNQLGQILEAFTNGLEWNNAIASIGRIFPDYDATELLESMIQIGVLE